MAATITVLVISFGVAALRLAWRRRSRGQRALVVAGWLALAFAPAPAAAWLGPEIGLVFALTFPSVIALSLVLLNAERRPATAGGVPRRPLSIPSPRRVAHETGRLLLLAGLCPLVAAAAAFALARLLAGTPNDRLAIVLIGFPVLWGLLCAGAAMARRPLHAGAALALLGVLALPGLV